MNRVAYCIKRLEPYPLAFIRKLEALPKEEFEDSFDVAEGYADGIKDGIKDLENFLGHMHDVLDGLEAYKESEREKEEMKANPPVPTMTFSNGDILRRTINKTRDIWTQ